MAGGMFGTAIRRVDRSVPAWRLSQAVTNSVAASASKVSTCRAAERQAAGTGLRVAADTAPSARHAADVIEECRHVFREGLAPPGHVPVRTDQHEPAFEQPHVDTVVQIVVADIDE